jgi:multiple sugar transport system permease protein
LGIPIYFVFISAFKDNIAIFDTPLAFPTSFSFNNFVEAWNTVKLGRGLINSLIVTTMSELVTIALALPAAYGIARSKGKVGAIVERFFALGFLIPAFAAMVPTLLLSIKLNMYHTLPFFSLFLSATTLPLSVILLAQFMRTIPTELEESAMLDGATRWQTLRFIYLPLTRAGIVLVVILNFLTYWNEYLFSLVLLGYDTSTRTVQVALPILITNSTQYGVLLAGTLISLIPVYIVYIFFHRKIEGALLAGSIKV